VERDLGTPLFGNTDEEIASHPQVVAHGDTLAGTHLELPLRWHNFGIDTADVDPRVEASTVMCFNEITGKNFSGTYTRVIRSLLQLYEWKVHTSTAVVRTLWAGETTFGPTVRASVSIKQSVLLLETEPRDVIFGGVHGLFRVMAVVSSVRGAVVIVTLRENEDIVAAAEGVLENGSGTQVDVGVMARSLIGGRTIKVPDTELGDVGDFLAHSLHVPRQLILRNQIVLQPPRAELTVVFERRPPSPSIQTSEARVNSTEIR
jgi:hypothetical protein